MTQKPSSPSRPPPSTKRQSAWLHQLQQLQQRWQALQTREQRILIAGGLVITILLWWLIGIEPAWRTIQQAERERPEALNKANRALALAAEIRQITGGQTSRLQEKPQALLERVMKERQFAKTQLQVVESDSSPYKLTISNANALELLNALDDIHRIGTLELTLLNIKKTAAGIVDAELSYKPVVK